MEVDSYIPSQEFPVVKSEDVYEAIRNIDPKDIEDTYDKIMELLKECH